MSNTNAIQAEQLKWVPAGYRGEIKTTDGVWTIRASRRGESVRPYAYVLHGVIATTTTDEWGFSLTKKRTVCADFRTIRDAKAFAEEVRS